MAGFHHDALTHLNNGYGMVVLLSFSYLPRSFAFRGGGLPRASIVSKVGIGCGVFPTGNFPRPSRPFIVLALPTAPLCP